MNRHVTVIETQNISAGKTNCKHFLKASCSVYFGIKSHNENKLCPKAALVAELQ